MFVTLLLGISLSAQQQTAAPVPNPLTATIDASKVAEPISKYDYGMFIEHLGNLINHGLWSELLDDRKFYYPITSAEPAQPANAPPVRGGALRRWVPIGPDASVTMDTHQPYVGDHSPKIALEAQTPHGIQQSGLPLVKGKAYVGRIILAGPSSAKIEIALVWGDAPPTARPSPSRRSAAATRNIRSDLLPALTSCRTPRNRGPRNRFFPCGRRLAHAR